ncbi:MAG TPA: L,D-transpeptidase family protein [Candidatus Eisenbacteria bacterium]|jgi:murein L,D-transpeptidase YcbB/YkuD|nr:L,D-transpeptidase family protein [Candidatus Eisenbacteria bacterium]
MSARRSFAFIVVLLVLALGVWWLYQGVQARTPVAKVQRQVGVLVQRKSVHLPGTSGAEASQNWSLVREFYRRRGAKPAWTDGRGPLDVSGQLVQLIQASGRSGLSPADYDPQGLGQDIDKLKNVPVTESPAAADLAALDVRSTYTYFRMANHLVNGHVPPRSLDPDWRTTPRAANLAANLENAIRAHRVQDGLAALEPKDPAYARLQQAWDQYARIVQAGGWPTIPGGRPMRPGESGARVTALVQRLTAGQDLRGAAPASYDATVGDAVRHFQSRHGIQPTGIVDTATLAALNVPAGSRLRQIQLNLERWHWLPQDLGDRYIIVNIPDYRLDVVEGGRSVMSMAVVVGKRMSPTPMFSDKAVAIEVNPYWNVPMSIAKAEIAPKVAADPAYLDRSHLHVLSKPGQGGEEVDASNVDWNDTSADVSYAIRQDPGPDNPLGRIKIALPNEYDVYLHDTPAGQLFSAKDRDFSHGCIRVEKPLDLATYLLRGSSEGSPEHLQELIASGENHWIAIKNPEPVHILYWTAWVDPDGTVQFRNDVYGHDQRLDQALRLGVVSQFEINPQPEQQPAGP